MTYKTKEERVSMDEAVARLCKRLSPYNATLASGCANIVWPNNRMKAQGAAFAVGRILRHMTNEGLVRWQPGGHGEARGYCLTYKGQTHGY